MKNKKFILSVFITLCALSVSAHRVLSNIPPKKSSHVKVTYSMNLLQKNVQYDFSKASIRKAYYSRLNELAAVINEKKCAVALRGYADSIGTYKGNWVLSQKRADAVKRYLITKGVSAELIVSTAFGSTEPIATNKTAIGRQQNRRVEIKIKDTSN